MGVPMRRNRNGAEPTEYVDVGLRRRLLGRGRWRVRIAGRDVLVLASPFRVWAVEDSCPHQGMSLAKCTVHGTALTCPFHGRTFDLRDGHPIPSRSDPSATGRPLTVFSAVRKGARLLIGLPPR
jgi:3-phenylpropionate/trans-cinnamate dioxygenase ferredoxin subunit